MAEVATQVEYELPKQDEWGFCHILFSAVGGDGANMAAKLLFKIGATVLNLDGGYDAKYGSEKKGTPTDVSVRFCKPGVPVRAVGPTTTPHYLVAFRERLIRPLELNRGLQPDAVCIVNTTKDPEEVRDIIQLHSGTVICVDATTIATKTRSRLNMPMLAMLCHELKFPTEVVKDAIAKQWPAAAEANLAAYDATIETAKRQYFAADGKWPLMPEREIVAKGPVGWKNMENGGAVDNLKFSTHLNDNSMLGLGLVPEFDQAVCINCAMCLTVCADPGAIVWKDGKMVGIDATYCKGCMRCVVICPETKKGKALKLPAILRGD